MAGREKKTKKLSNASKESPISNTKQPSILSYMSPPPQEAEGAMNQESSAPGAKKATKTGKAKKLNPTTKINTLRGRSKTKANFKLIQTLAQQSVKPVMRRGRPPLKKHIKTDSPEKSEESSTADDSMAKKRGRKKAVTPSAEVTEDIKTDGSDAAKPAATKDTESKKTVIKNVSKKVVKKKQLLVAQKGLTKRKVLLSKKILKTDAKQVDPKILKKNLTAKLKSVSEKLELKKSTTDKDSSKASSESLELEIPVSEIKKEPGLSETPSPLISDSRSSSPRTGTRKRNSADIIISKAVLSDVPSSPGIKSPYSTRSERSSPLPLTPNESPKVLRNGRQRKPKGLKNTLLSETVGQEYNKRRRLLSDTKVGECLELENKIKRFRSCSRDGSEISKCSDVTESDLSTCDSASIDIDNKLDDSKTCKIQQPMTVAKIKEERISIDTSPNVTTAKPLCNNTTAVDVSKADVSSVAVASPVGTINRESVDSENNNTDDKIKTDGLLGDKLGKPEDIDTNVNEKIAEKSLILDNMSKAFNEFVPNKKGNIRRSARQRKSTVKAKEHEETILAEQTALEMEIDLEKLKTETVETHESSPVLTEVPKSDLLLPEDEIVIESPTVEQPSTKITTKTFYGDPKRLSLDSSKTSVSTNDETAIVENEEIPVSEKPSTEDDNVDDIKLHLDEDEEVVNGPEDDTQKENIECSLKPADPQDIGKLINKLRHFEEQDKKKQEEKSSLQQTVMVSSDVILIPKADQNASVDRLVVDKSMDKGNVINCLENNSAISIVKKDQIRKSFDIDLPSSVTLIKKTATTTRKHSTNSKEADTVTILDKSLGKDLTMELRKSIDKGILSLESSTSNLKTSTINTGNGQSLSISLKPQTPKDLTLIPVTTASSVPVASVTAAVSNPVTALISLPTPSPLMITPIPMSNNVPVPISSATVVPKLPETQTHILTIEPSNTTVTDPVATMLVEDVVVAPKENIPQTISVIPKSMVVPPITLPSGISIISAVVATQPKVNETPQVNSDITVVKQDVEQTCSSESKENITSPPLVKSPPPSDVQVPQLVPESPVSQKQKQDVLRAVGLISLKEADEAKQEKEKQKEIIKSTKPDGYTGTLKTVIKLNRGIQQQDKKSRSPLKMTLQKNKSRTSKVATEGLSADSESDESPYYTIHKEIGGAGYGSGSTENHVSSGGHRKTHYSYRFNNHDHTPADPLADVVSDTSVPKEAAKNLVIPEKASSFGIHPGRLCQDQCFYCGGKFGLFDTPCHVAQIKSSDRQKKILDNEEKLTVDSCLCDACYRHVDRRANCPGYRRRVGGGGGILGGPVGALIGAGVETEVADGTLCHATMCRKPAPHTLRRKWLVKMRNRIAKVVQLDLDYPGLHTIPLCDMHYQAISHLMVCGLCKGGLSRNHVHYINQEYKTLNPLLAELGIPVVFNDKPAVCKLCRYFCTLLCKPPSPHQTDKNNFMKTYKRRLLIAHSVDVPVESDHEPVEEAPQSDSSKDVNMPDGKEKKKSKNGKSKSKKSAEVRKSTDENHSHDANSPTHDGSQENKEQNSQHKQGALEEDIESLISTNTIPIPNSNPSKTTNSSDPRPVSEISDNSDLEMMVDLDPAALDKQQSELQLLLQKCNIPSSTILQKGPIANLTQKSRNILKVHNATAISKNTQNQKVLDKNARRIQKLGQIITKNTDLEKAICSRLPNREEFTLEAAINEKAAAAAAAAAAAKDLSGMNILKNLALNDECTIESLPAKPLPPKPPVDINSLKSKWQLSNSFTQIKKNLKALSQVKKPKGDQGDNYSNPVRRLETNPSISVRELFPGEEEMNLQCSIEFGNVKGITPDGWEKCSSTIQYDADTKRLWNELQKPYGNQSSFLRHLILLEKYFRNGDLILSQNANCNAVTYSESVQNRLRSYDNIPTGETIHLPLIKPTAPPPPTDMTAPEPVKPSHTSSLIDFRKQKTNSGKSLLKTNQMPLPHSMDHLNSHSHMKNSGMVRHIENLLPTSFNHAKIPKNVPISLAQINQSLDPSFNNFSQADKDVYASLSQIEKINRLLYPPFPLRPDFSKPPEMKIPSLPPSINIEAKSTPVKADTPNTKQKVPSLPPELIAIGNTDTQRKSIENVLKNIQQLAKGSSTPVSKPFPPHTEQTPGLSPIATSMSPAGLMGKPADVPASSAASIPAPPSATETTKKTKTSKQWRPTLIPITDESKSKVAKEVLYQTADGRRLPSLVQVMSGGKPYHITIQDYNKMCVMRREKLQQIHKAEMAKKPSAPPTPASVYDFTIDPPVNLNPINPLGSTSTKLPSPPPYPTSITPTTQQPSATTTSAAASKLLDQPIITIPNTSSTKTSTVTSVKPVTESQLEVTPITSAELNTASLLKNVGLKNITIAPITSSLSQDQMRPPKSVSASPPSSIMSPTTSSCSIVSIPSIISHLGPSISVTTEAGVKINTSSNSSAVAPTSLVSCVQPITITSQAVLLPKIPKSLTVIPQTVTPPTQTTQQSPQEP